MEALVIIFLMSLSLGQLGAVQLASSVQIYIHELFLTILWAVVAWRKPDKFRSGIYIIGNLFRMPVIGEVGGFVLAGLVSLGAALYKFTPEQVLVGSLYLVRFAFYASILLLVSASGARHQVWLGWLYGSSVLVAVLGLFQLLWYPSLQNLVYAGWDPHHYRLFSSFLDPNFTGIYLLLGLLLGFLYINRGKLYWITQAVLFGAMLATYSRSTYAAGAVVLFMGLYRFMGKAAAFGAIGFFVLLILLFPRVPGDTLRLDRFDSSLGRFKSWQWALEQMAASPVVGHGFSTLRFIPRPEETIEQTLASRASSGVDNSIFFVGATTGLLGLSTFVLLLRSIFVQSQILLKDPKTSLFGYIFFLSVIAMLVHSQFINSFFYPWVMIWLWIVCAVSIRRKIA